MKKDENNLIIDPFEDMGYKYERDKELDVIHGTLIITSEGPTNKNNELTHFLFKNTEHNSYELGDIYRKYLMKNERADRDIEEHDEKFHFNFNFYSSDISFDKAWSKNVSIHFIPASEIYNFVSKVEKEIQRLNLSASINYKIFQSNGGISSYYSEIVEGEILNSAEIYHDL